MGDGRRCPGRTSAPTRLADGSRQVHQLPSPPTAVQSMLVCMACNAGRRTGRRRQWPPPGTPCAPARHPSAGCRRRRTGRRSPARPPGGPPAGVCVGGVCGRCVCVGGWGRVGGRIELGAALRELWLSTQARLTGRAKGAIIAGSLPSSSRASRRLASSREQRQRLSGRIGQRAAAARRAPAPAPRAAAATLAGAGCRSCPCG